MVLIQNYFDPVIIEPLSLGIICPMNLSSFFSSPQQLTPSKQQGLLVFVLIFLLVYPWINPIAPSPSSGVVPWLFSLACGLVAWLLIVDKKGPWFWQGANWLAWWLIGLVLAILSHTASFNGETVLTLAGLALLALAIDIGAKAKNKTSLLLIIAYAWFMAAFISSIIALSQYFNFDDTLYPIFNIANEGEAFGNLRQRNQLATLLNIGLAVVIVWPMLAVKAGYLGQNSNASPGISSGIATRINGWQWLITLLAIQLITAANAASVSRTGMVGVLVLFGLTLVWFKNIHKDSLLIATASLLSYAFWVLVLPYASEWITGTHGYSLFGRLGLEGLGSCTSRKFLYLNVIDLIIEKPFWGWGWRELSLAHFSGAYDNRFCEILDNAHNLPLHFAVELGLMVTLLLIVPFVWMCIKAKPWAASTVASQMAWAVLSLVLLHSMLEYPLWYGPFMLAFGMSLGLLWQSPTQQPKNQKVAQFRSALPGWLGFLGLIGLFYATFDYIRISQIYTVPEDRFAIFADAPYSHAKQSWLFAGPVYFAVLLETPVTPQNAQAKYDLAKKIMHYSPEGAVIEVQLQAAQFLGHANTEIESLKAQYKKVYPSDYAKYLKALANPDTTEVVEE